MTLIGLTAAFLISLFLILSLLDAWETRPRHKQTIATLAAELIEQRGQRWDAEYRAAEAEAGRERAEASLVEVTRELWNQETRLTQQATVIDLRHKRH